MIGRPPGSLRLHAIEAELGQIKPIHENVDHADRIVLADPLLQAFREQCALTAIHALNKTLHQIPPSESIGES